MKSKVLIVALAAVLLLSACSTTAPQDNNIAATNEQNENPVSIDQESNSSGEEIHYNLMSADWPVYNDVKELTNAGNVIVLGKITDISFEILDRMTAKPPTSASETENCYLNIIYTVEVITTYKGISTKTIKVRMLGGLEGVYVKEQIAVLGDMASEGISIMDGSPNLEIGQTYLFVLYQYGDSMPTLVNVKQGVYGIDDPLAKDEYSYVSLKEIISSFGEDNWAAFESYKNAFD